MAERRSAGIEISPIPTGVRVSHEAGGHVYESDLTFQEAIQVLLHLGAAIGVVNDQERKAGLPVTKQSALHLQTGQGGVATLNGKAHLVVEVQNFPTLRLPIADEALKSTAEALLQIASTPLDVRNQKTN